jgi:two-component system OmpR family response regulator
MASLPQSTTRRMPGVLQHRTATVSAIVASPRILGADPVASSTDHWGMSEPNQPVRVLVADDEPTVQNMVAAYLTEYDIRVTSASSGQAAKTQLATSQPSLIILDLRIDRQNGLELLCEIRACCDVPVITTGYGCSETDRVEALERGADDHIAKPFSPRELLARIRAILRRRRKSERAGPQRRERDHYRFGGWQLDQRTRRLTGVNGDHVPLTKGEFTLLIAFLNAPRRPLTRQHLVQATRVHQDTFDRSIDVQVLRLRRKLDIDPSAPRVIRAERGVGYVFDLPVERTDTKAQSLFAPGT